MTSLIGKCLDRVQDFVVSKSNQFLMLNLVGNGALGRRRSRTLVFAFLLLSPVVALGEFQDIVWQNQRVTTSTLPGIDGTILTFSDGTQILNPHPGHPLSSFSPNDVVGRFDLEEGRMLIIAVRGSTGLADIFTFHPAGVGAAPGLPPTIRSMIMTGPAGLTGMQWGQTRGIGLARRGGALQFHVQNSQRVFNLSPSGDALFLRPIAFSGSSTGLFPNGMSGFEHLSIPALETDTAGSTFPRIRVDLEQNRLEFPGRDGQEPATLRFGTALSNTLGNDRGSGSVDYEFGLRRVRATLNQRISPSHPVPWDPHLQARLTEFLTGMNRGAQAQVGSNAPYFSLLLSEAACLALPEIAPSLLFTATQGLEQVRDFNSSSSGRGVYYLSLRNTADGSSEEEKSLLRSLFRQIVEDRADVPVLLVDATSLGLNGDQVNSTVIDNFGSFLHHLVRRNIRLRMIVAGAAVRPPYSVLQSSGNLLVESADSFLTEEARLGILRTRLRAQGIDRPLSFFRQVVAEVQALQARRQSQAENPLTQLDRATAFFSRALNRPNVNTPQEAATQILEEARQIGRYPSVVSQRALQIPRLLGPHGDGTYAPMDGVQDVLEVITERTLNFLNYPNRRRPYHVTVLMGPPGTGKNRIAGDVARILNGNTGPVPYEIISFAGTTQGNPIEELRRRIEALRTRSPVLPTLILDEVHLNPTALIALLPLLGDSDAAAAAGLNLEALDIKILLNVNQESAAYQRILRVSPHEDAYRALSRQVFLDALAASGIATSTTHRAALEALVSRLAQDFLVLRPPTPEDQIQLREFSRRILGRFEQTHSIRLLAQAEVHSRLAEIAVRDSTTGFRGADSGAIGEIESAFSRFLLEHPNHEFRGSYQLVVAPQSSLNGMRPPRFELREVNDLAPVLEADDNYTRMRRAIESSLLGSLERVNLDLRNDPRRNRRALLEESRRQLSAMLRGFQAAGRSDLFHPQSLQGGQPHPRIERPIAEIRYPVALNAEDQRRMTQHMREALEVQFRRIQEAINPAHAHTANGEITQALETIRTVMNELQTFVGPRDQAYLSWMDSLHRLTQQGAPPLAGATAGAEQGPRLATEDTGMAAGVVADSLLRLIAGDHYTSRRREVERMSQARGHQTPEDESSAATDDPLLATSAACRETLRAKFNRLYRSR